MCINLMMQKGGQLCEPDRENTPGSALIHTDITMKKETALSVELATFLFAFRGDKTLKYKHR